MQVDLNTAFRVRNAVSRNKAIRFFGEHSIPILVGAGSATKLGAFYGATLAQTPGDSITPPPLLPLAHDKIVRIDDKPENSSDGHADAAHGPCPLSPASSGPLEPVSAASDAPLLASPVSPLPSEQRLSGRSRHLPAVVIESPPRTADALLIDPSEPESPVGHFNAAVQESRNIATGAELTAAAWRRRGSHASASSAIESDETDSARIRWLQEMQRNGTHSSAQIAKAESISRSFRHAPRPISIEALEQYASTQTALALIPVSTQRTSARRQSFLETAMSAASAAASARNSSVTLVRSSIASMSPSEPSTATTSPTSATAHRKLSWIGSVSSGYGSSAASKPILDSKSSSLRKLQSIFGEACPVDIPVRQIESDGLWAILMSNLPLCYFMLSLLKEQSPELLFFVIDAHDFEQTVFESNAFLQNAAQDLFALYLAKDAPFELNITHKTRRAVAAAIQASSLQSFRRALEETGELLESAFVRFKAGSFFTMMREHLGVHTVLHQEATARMLLECMREAAPHDSHALDESRRRTVSSIRARLDMFAQERMAMYLLNGAR